MNKDLLQKALPPPALLFIIGARAGTLGANGAGYRPSGRVNFFSRFSRRFSGARIPPRKLFCLDITPVLTPTSRCISAGGGRGCARDITR